MTWNLYLGADLQPVMHASPDRVVAAAARAWAHVRQTDFPARAGAIARAIASRHPDVAALQEVALWESAPYPAASPFTTEYDFLQLVLDSLNAGGASYGAASVNAHYSAALPVSGSRIVRFTERNAIIARTDLATSRLFVTDPQSTIFAARIPLTILGRALDVTRGFGSVDVRTDGQWVRLFTVHLEAYSAEVRQAQARELVTAIASSPYDVIVAGDLNSLRGRPDDAWGILTAAGLTDVWAETMSGAPGFTVSFGDDLAAPPGVLDHDVDYVLRKTTGLLAGVPGSGAIVGDQAGDRTPEGLWPSDHAGVFVALRIAKH